MNVEVPIDLAPFVQRMVAERRFLTESDVLAEGLRLLQARETLRQEVRKGFEQLDAGLGIGPLLCAGTGPCPRLCAPGHQAAKHPADR